MEQPRTFILEDIAVDVSLGDKKKTVTIRDLSYKKQKVLLEKIVRLSLQRDTLPAAIEAMPSAIHRQMVKGKEEVSHEDAITMFLDKVVDAYNNLTGEQLVDLLMLFLDGQLDASEIDMMGGGEMLELLRFCMERQLVPLKNFNASLTSMLSKPKEQGGK